MESKKKYAKRFDKLSQFMAPFNFNGSLKQAKKLHQMIRLLKKEIEELNL